MGTAVASPSRPGVDVRVAVAPFPNGHAELCGWLGERGPKAHRLLSGRAVDHSVHAAGTIPNRTFVGPAAARRRWSGVCAFVRIGAPDAEEQ